MLERELGDHGFCSLFHKFPQKKGSCPGEDCLEVRLDLGILWSFMLLPACSGSQLLYKPSENEEILTLELAKLLKKIEREI